MFAAVGAWPISSAKAGAAVMTPPAIRANVVASVAAVLDSRVVQALMNRCRGGGPAVGLEVWDCTRAPSTQGEDRVRALPWYTSGCGWCGNFRGSRGTVMRKHDRDPG